VGVIRTSGPDVRKGTGSGGLLVERALAVLEEVAGFGEVHG
jgi:hypothetical protein